MRNLQGRSPIALGAEPALAIDQESLGELGPRGIELELDDRHRRHGGQVVGVEHAQQGVGELGELVVQLVLDPSGQQREGLDQPLDVGVGAAVGLQPQPARRGGILPGELLGELADEGQLALVVVVQRPAHLRCRPAGSRSLRSRASRSSRTRPPGKDPRGASRGSGT